MALLPLRFKINSLKMTPKERISEIFEVALELPPDQRGNFVAQQCSDDPAALEQIKLLIEADEKADSFAVIVR